MQRFVKDTIINRIWDANNLHCASSGKLDVIPALFFSFDKPLDQSIGNNPNNSNISFQLFLNELEYP